MKRKIKLIRIEGNIAHVPLTKGHFTQIDAEDTDLIDRYNWQSLIGAKTIYAKTNIPLPCGKLRSVYMHRLIMRPDDGMHVDHIDGNGINNTKANLRVAHAWQNMCNIGLPKTNTSGIKGVRLHKPTGKWIAEIGADKKRIYLGLFADKGAAFAAYVDASRNMHGEFSRLR